MRLVRGSERMVFELDGNFMRGLAVASNGASECEVWEDRMAPGAATPPHAHDCEEIVLVTNGALAALVDGEERRAEAGDALIVPPHMLHQLRNDGDGEAVSVAVLGRVGAATFLPDGTRIEAPWQR